MIVDYLYLPRPQYMDCLFFPSEENVEKLIKYIYLAKVSIDVCVFCLTNNKLANALFYLHKIAGVKVRIISDDMSKEMKGADCQDLSNTGIPVRLDADTKAHMHHKFAIIDNRILINGSFNWTVQAVSSNQENIVVLDSPDLCASFSKEFNKLWENFKDNQLKHENTELPYNFRKIVEDSSKIESQAVRKNRNTKKITKALYHVDYNPYNYYENSKNYPK